MICQKCGNIVADGVKFCTNCGAKVEAPAYQPAAPAAARICSMCGSKLEADERFCTICGTPASGAAPVQQPAYPGRKAHQAPASDPFGVQRPKKKSAFVRLLWLWILILVLAAAAVFFCITVMGNHSKAVAAMREMDFAAAQEAMARTLVGESLYPEDAAYISAGLLMEDGKYDKAIKAFEKLDEYEDAEICVQEAKYRQAAQLVKDKSFDEALKLYADLDEYKDSKDQIVEVKLAQINQLIADGKDAEALNQLLALADEGSEKAKTKIAQLEQTLYEKAAVLYRDGAYVDAKELFSLLGAYEASADYLTLISLHLGELDTSDSDALLWDTLVPLIGLEDAAEILLSDVDRIYSFLTGD